MNDLTAFQRDILYAIAGHESPKGLKIKRILDDYYGHEINHGRLYPNLDDLVAEGLVDKGEKDKRTNWYTLTEKGMRQVKTRREWEDTLLETTGLPAD